MVPEAVARLVEDWHVAGSPIQQAFAWSLPKWQRRFPCLTDVLSALPERVDRGVVEAHCAEAASSPETAVAAFVVAMTWGYGTVGYGPYRTQRILSSTDDAAGKLRMVAATVADKGAVEGYRLLANDCRLKWLGPAFGTKYLTFVPQAPEGPTALILDSVVGGWLDHHADLELDFEPWSTSTYETYVTTMTNWATALGASPRDVELCIFTAARSTS